jgi:hypothetical protein
MEAMLELFGEELLAAGVKVYLERILIMAKSLEDHLALLNDSTRLMLLEIRLVISCPKSRWIHLKTN